MKINNASIVLFAPFVSGVVFRTASNDLFRFFDVHHKRIKNEINSFDNWKPEKQRQYVFMNIKKYVEHAYAHIPFYRMYYDNNQFDPTLLKSFEDIKRIPIINKEVLLEYPIEKRSNIIHNAQKVNTGGSSGQTLDFYKDIKTRPRHELAHMNYIWSKIGYRPSDLRLILIGANTVKDGLDFCFRSNAFRLDIYKEFSETSSYLKKVIKQWEIKYLHGYPSTIYEFALYCAEHDHCLRDSLKKTLKGAFLGSEYPYPVYRDFIENVFEIKTISWYGHTEGAVLAWEKFDKYRYFPFHTYGFTEISGEGHLVGSSYNNFASPFIRYDTGDKITEPEIKDGFLTSFAISDGRSGEYIMDAHGKKISCTALIFGRHHKIFDYCSHIQLCQQAKGQVTVIYVPRDQQADFNPANLFDISNIAISFSFRKVKKPVKTKTGKLNLIVKSEDLEEQ